MDETTADFEEHAEFCDDQLAEKNYAIKKAQKELDQTTADFEEHAKFCDDQIAEKDYAIKKAQK